MTTYLRFEDKLAAQVVLAPWIDIADLMSGYIGCVAVDVIGTIYKPTGRVLQTEEGNVPELAPVPGWHINLSAPMPELAEFEIAPPANPVRQFFAG